MTVVPRIVVSAPSSGQGKTAVTVGLLAGYAARGLSVAGYKVGPDHVDAAYLGLAAGRPGRNLDARLVGVERTGPLFAHGCQGADLAVVEGSMGLFDSLAGRPEADSTAALAVALRAPVVLVVDVAAMGQSVAALVHGFRAYDEMLWLGGVILLGIASNRHEQLLREALDDIGVPVFGALRRGALPVVLPTRGQGIVPVLHGSVEARRAVRQLGEAVSATVDLDRLRALAGSAPRLPVAPWSATDAAADADLAEPPTLAGRQRPVIAVAGVGDGGSRMIYGYVETAELLSAAGAEVVTVDPLRDEELPAGVNALVVGGALPESYAAELSANRRLGAAVGQLARAGRPVLAEGAGLLWLAREFDGRPMCGVLDAVGMSTDRVIGGYRSATARASTPVASLGARLVGFKQHRGVLRPRAGRTPAWTWPGSDPEGFVWRGVHASQLTLHWAGAPEIARRLVLAAATVEAPSAGGGPGGSGPGGGVPGGGGPGGGGPGGGVPGGGGPADRAEPEGVSA